MARTRGSLVWSSSLRSKKHVHIIDVRCSSAAVAASRCVGVVIFGISSKNISSSWRLMASTSTPCACSRSLNWRWISVCWASWRMKSVTSHCSCGDAIWSRNARTLVMKNFSPIGNSVDMASKKRVLNGSLAIQ
jgi:hypothetical protein